MCKFTVQSCTNTNLPTKRKVSLETGSSPQTVHVNDPKTLSRVLTIQGAIVRFYTVADQTSVEINGFIKADVFSNQFTQIVLWLE